MWNVGCGHKPSKPKLITLAAVISNFQIEQGACVTKTTFPPRKKKQQRLEALLASFSC